MTDESKTTAEQAIRAAMAQALRTAALSDCDACTAGCDECMKAMATQVAMVHRYMASFFDRRAKDGMGTDEPVVLHRGLADAMENAANAAR